MTLHPLMSIAGVSRRFLLLSAALTIAEFGAATAQSVGSDVSARVPLPQVEFALPAGASDAGSLPASQAIPSIVIELKRTAAQQSDLDSFLTTLQKAGTTDYHHWMTPSSYAARFAPTADALAPVTAWLAIEGLQVQSTSPGGMRIVVSGTVQQASAAFGIQLHRLAMPSGDGILVSGTPSIPAALAASIRAVSGLQVTPGLTDGVLSLATAVDANTAAVVTADLSTTGSAEELADVLEQASAQGQSILALHADPAAVPSRALSLVIAGSAAIVASPMNMTPRPDWQTAAGLPDDALRATPDAAVSADTTALAAALQSIITKVAARQGEVAATFYKLAPETGVFTHADNSLATGSWSSTDGLGTVNAAALIKAWPDGATPPLNAKLVNSSEVITHGASLTITVTITGGSGTPTGTVTFASAQGGTLGTSTLNASGVATYTTTTLAGGQYGFSGTYNGDSTYATDTSNIDTVTVNPEAAVVTGTVPAGGVGVGANIPVTVTVTAASGVGTPSGIVTVYPYGTTIATQTFTGTLAAGTTTGTATAAVSVPASNVGSFTFQVNCTANASYSCGSPTSFAVTEVKGTPVAVLATPSNTSATNTILTATVAAPTGGSATAPTPTGSVQFLDGTTVLGSGTLTTGTATYTGALATASSRSKGFAAPDATTTTTTTHSLTAVYSGDTNYATVTSAAVADATTTTLITTTTSLSSSSGYAGTYGTIFTLLSSVTPTTYAASGSPTGTVTITDSVQGVVATGTLATGATSVTVSSLSVGTHTLTATYSGDTSYAASTSTTSVIITVTTVNGTITATVTPAGSIPYGYNATLNITVTLASGTNPPSGPVTAVISGNNGTYTGTLAGATGSAIGTAAISFPVPPPGTYVITITCNTNVICASATAKVTSVKGFTTTTLAVTPNVPQAGIPVSVSATVANSGTGTGTYNYSGTASFYSAGRFLATAAVTNGVATTTVVLSSTAAQTLTATYSGDANWNSSTSAGTTVTPTPLDATISLSSNVTSGVVGQNITLTAALTSSDSTSTLVPSGTVTFYDTVNGTVVVLGSSALVSNTINTSYATISTTGLIAGTHNITAIYSGDTVFNKLTSSVLLVNIGDFTLTFIPSTLQIAAGGSGTTTAVLSAINNFTGSVALGCTPPAASLSTCSITPSTITAGGTAQITVLTTTKSSVVRPSQFGLGGTPRLLAAAGLGGLFCFCFARGRRRRVAALFMLMLAVLLVSGGCGLGTVDSTNNSSGSTGTGSGGTTTTGTPLGTYTFTITAASVNAAVNARHTFNLSVTVQ